MDYCSSCRRHLNGALVCPGCGAYAPDIAPLPHGGRAVAAPAATAAWPEPVREHAASAPPYDEPEPVGGDADVEDPVATREGRAARRRQRERWRKNQRRAVVATAVALVGGGLTVSAMNRGGSGQQTQASQTPDVTSMGVAETLDQGDAVLPPAGTGKHRKPDTTASGSSTNGGVTQERSATATHTDSARTQPYTVSGTPSTKTAAGSTQQTSTAAGGGSGTTSGRSSTSSSAGGSTTSNSTSSSDSTSSSSSSSSSSTSTSGSSDTSGTPQSTGTSGSGTSTASTSPSGICLLGLVCVS
ncbi:SCO2400 family protein [Streptomyces sp. NPDC001286]